jgi:ribosomal protein S18 acetylase RimI-like enzyme
MNDYEIRLAYSELDNVKILFQEYVDALGVNLEFQHYDDEINSLPGKYALPDGRIYVLYYRSQLAGCIALRRLSEDSCEIKRLFVRPEYRGLKLGKKLTLQIINDAKELKYKEIYLDTLYSLESALKMYKKLGFHEIPAYYNNPLENVIYLKMQVN